MQRLAILVQRTHPKSGKKRWALVSRKKVKGKRRVLRWFKGKPSPARVKKEEARVQYFKRQGALTVEHMRANGNYFVSPHDVAQLAPAPQEKLAVSYGRDHQATQAAFKNLWQLHSEGRVEPRYLTVIKDIKRHLTERGFITNRQLDYLNSIARASRKNVEGKHPRPNDPPRPETPPEPPPPSDDPLAQAHEMGQRAHGVVGHPIPLHDAELRELLHKHTKSDQSHPLFNKIMEAWVNGWTKARDEKAKAEAADPDLGEAPPLEEEPEEAPPEEPPPPPEEPEPPRRESDQKPGEDAETYRQRKQAEEITQRMFEALQQHNPDLKSPEQLTHGDKIKLNVLLAHALPLLRAHHAKGTLTNDLLTHTLGLDRVELESVPKKAPPPPPPPPKEPPKPKPTPKPTEKPDDEDEDEDESEDEDEDDEGLPKIDPEHILEFGERSKEVPPPKGKKKGKPGKAEKPSKKSKPKVDDEDEELPQIDPDLLTEFGEGKKGKPGKPEKKKDKPAPEEPKKKGKDKGKPEAAKPGESKWVRVIRLRDNKIIQVRRGRHTDKDKYKPLGAPTEEPKKKSKQSGKPEKKKTSKPEKKLRTTTWAKPVKLPKKDKKSKANKPGKPAKQSKPATRRK